LKLFVCEEVEGVHYMTSDYRLQCSGEEYATYSLIASLGILVYPIGCPLLYWFILKRHEHKLHSSKECLARYGFVYERYEPDYYWWEVVEMIRKFLLTGVILFLAPGSIAQLAMALLIASYFMAAHVKCEPFSNPEENHLQSVSLISTVLVLVLGIMIKAAAQNTALQQKYARYDNPPAWLLIVLCACTGVFGAALAFYQIYGQVNKGVKKASKILAVASSVWKSSAVNNHGKVEIEVEMQASSSSTSKNGMGDTLAGGGEGELMIEPTDWAQSGSIRDHHHVVGQDAFSAATDSMDERYEEEDGEAI